MYFETGISLHGMKVLMQTDFKPSLYDLKKYDSRANDPELTLLKKIAYAKPFQSNKDKLLSPEDFRLFTASTPAISETWKTMSCETQHVNYKDYGKYSILMFHQDGVELVKNGLLKYGFHHALLEGQADGETFLHPAPPKDKPKNVVLGWIKYVRVGNNVRILEVQSQLEANSLYPLGSLTKPILTESIRQFLNDGVKTFELLSYELKDHRITPHDAYTRLPRSCGFDYIAEKKVWKYPGIRTTY
jgi:hypothetical protein